MLLREELLVVQLTGALRRTLRRMLRRMLRRVLRRMNVWASILGKLYNQAGYLCGV